MTISPRDPVALGPIEMHVVGIAPTKGDSESYPSIFAHYAYFNAMDAPMIRHDSVAVIVAVPARARDARKLAVRIEAAMATNYPAIEARTNVDVQHGLARFGAVQYVLLAIMLAVLLCAMLVMVSVLAHTFAQHMAEQAILQVLGFGRRTLFAGFALASLVLVTTGVAAGLGVGLFTLHLVRDMLTGAFHLPGLPAWAWWGMPVWLGILLLIALIWPALRMVGLRPIHVRAL